MYGAIYFTLRQSLQNNPRFVVELKNWKESA